MRKGQHGSASELSLFALPIFAAFRRFPLSLFLRPLSFTDSHRFFEQFLNQMVAEQVELSRIPAFTFLCHPVPMSWFEDSSSWQQDRLQGTTVMKGPANSVVQSSLSGSVTQKTHATSCNAAITSTLKHCDDVFGLCFTVHLFWDAECTALRLLVTPKKARLKLTFDELNFTAVGLVWLVTRHSTFEKEFLCLQVDDSSGCEIWDGQTGQMMSNVRSSFGPKRV